MVSKKLLVIVLYAAIFREVKGYLLEWGKN